MSLMTLNFESQYLKQSTNINIILPDIKKGQDPKDFYSSGKKYKCVWLLHGAYGDYSDWVRYSRIELFACERDVAVVTMSGFNGYYTNWPEFGQGFDIYSFIIDELMTMVPAWFPISDKREDNFIFGLSMGGAGAANLCARNPEKFGGVAVLAGLVADLIEMAEKGDHAGVIQVKHAGGPEKFIDSDANTLAVLRRNADKLPPLYYACGTKDHNYTNTYQFLPGFAKEIGWDATFHEIPGYGHEWRFWDESVELALDFFGMTKTENNKD